MSGWKSVSDEISGRGTVYDVVRRGHLEKLHKHTGRNVILYYSGWLQKQGVGVSADSFSITDADKSGFMAVIHGLDRSKGLDLILHTPGGDVGATESLGEYLRSMFSTDIRVIVPQLAMSAGTMLACLSKEIIMGKHSSIGPIDPQLSGLAAQGVIDEFERAKREIAENASAIHVWQPIIAKYPPTLIGSCMQAIQWAQQMVKTWLESGMFIGESASAQVAKIAQGLGDHSEMKAHNRHISAVRARELGLKVTELEADAILQDLVLTVHHCCLQTLADTTAYKIVENQNGLAVISDLRPYN